MPAPLRGEQKRVLKAARGRGNQGDWVHSSKTYKVEKEHAEHNAAVEVKKALRAAKRIKNKLEKDND